MPKREQETAVSPVRTVAIRVRELRLKHGLTQREFGKGIDYSREMVTKIETGAYFPRPKFIQRCKETYSGAEALVEAFDEAFPAAKHQVHSGATKEIPEAILKYLRLFPEFAVPHDLAGQYVRTSHASFLSAVECILNCLSEDDSMFTTDSLVFDRAGINYWPTAGMRYLELNYEATMRGVLITRVFIVAQGDRQKYSELIYQIGRLHKRAGVTPLLADYKTLPASCHYEFALFGDRFVDETVYDFRSSIVENFIHWSGHKLASFKEKEHLIRSFTDSQWSVRGRMAGSFDEVKRVAQKIRRELPQVED